MPMTNEYLPFATAVGANTITQAAYAASAVRTLGHQPGVALSEVENTVLRQLSVAITGLAQFAANYGTQNVLDNGSPVDFEAAFKSAFDALIEASQGWQPGDVKATLSDDIPTGWAGAFGQIVSRTGTHARVFAKYGTRFGAGDGSTTFQYPDLRGEFLRGLDDGRGVDPDSGRAIGSGQGFSNALHGHPYLANTGNANTDAVGGIATDQGGVATVHSAYTGTPSDLNQTRLIGGSGGAEARPRNVAVLYLIKL